HVGLLAKSRGAPQSPRAGHRERLQFLSNRSFIRVTFVPLGRLSGTRPRSNRRREKVPLSSLDLAVRVSRIVKSGQPSNEAHAKPLPNRERKDSAVLVRFTTLRVGCCPKARPHVKNVSILQTDNNFSFHPSVFASLTPNRVKDEKVDRRGVSPN